MKFIDKEVLFEYLIIVICVWCGEMLKFLIIWLKRIIEYIMNKIWYDSMKDYCIFNLFKKFSNCKKVWKNLDLNEI